MHTLLAKLTAGGTVVSDGAWGTELQLRGLGLGEFPDFWNLLHPEKVAEVAEAYVEAGSQVILTNTFGANRLRLAGHELGERVSDINQQGVRISLDAAKGRALVFASIGPSGKLLISGETSEAELQATFQEQASALAEGGAHALVVETMTDLTEASIAVRCAHATGLPVVACMVFDSGREKDRTAMGVTIEQAVAALTKAGADVLGANCGQGIAGFVPVCRRMRAATSLPLWMKANAGMPELVNGRAAYRTLPEAFARVGPELVRAGADFVGGCCGTNPFFIRALRRELPLRPV